MTSDERIHEAVWMTGSIDIERVTPLASIEAARVQAAYVQDALAHAHLVELEHKARNIMELLKSTKVLGRRIQRPALRL